MFSVDLPVSLKVSLRSSPLSRLMPLKEASCAVVVIWVMILLYWPTRLERRVCEAGSTTGAVAAPTGVEGGVGGADRRPGGGGPQTAPGRGGEPTVTAPIVDEAASLFVVK